MAKKFKAKKKFSLKKCKVFIYMFLILGMSFCTFYYVYHLKFATNNEQFIKYLLEDANHFKEYDHFFKKTVYKVSHYLTGFDTSKPVSLLENKFLYKSQKTVSTKELTYKEKQKQANEGAKSLDTNTGKENVTLKKRIYIYSTHQTEGYAPGNLKDFNITPDVMMASYLLKDRLEKLGAEVLVEERKMKDYLTQHQLNYDYSYKASRYYLEDTLKKNQKFDLVIDLHRDALAKNLSTTTIGDKNYAKILFVLGGKAATYQSNLAKVTQLNSMIKEKYPTLTRGLLARDYSIYNQDLGDNMILLELGGNENTVDEVMNTVEALAPIIYTYLGGNHG